MIARLLEGVPAAARCARCSRCCWRRSIAAPLVANDYLLTVLILILYFAYVGQAWNIMMGFAGQLSLGHALYVGLGGYTAAALYVHFGIGPGSGCSAAIPVAVAARRGHRLPRVPLRRRRRLFRDPDHRLRRIRPHRLRPFGAGSAARPGFSCPSPIHAQRSLAACAAGRPCSTT